MPFYTCFAFSDSLSAAQKANIAEEITRIHTRLTGAPRSFFLYRRRKFIALLGGAPRGRSRRGHSRGLESGASAVFSQEER